MEFGLIEFPLWVKLHGDGYCVLEHGPALREDHHSCICGQLGLIVLEVIAHILLLDESSDALDVQDAGLLKDALLHDGLIAYHSSAVHHLQEASLELVGVIVLFRVHLSVL